MTQPMTQPSTTPPFAVLTPDFVLDAIESLGLLTDGRQLALNSYENRVYQVGLEDAAPVVAKFYRPARWSDEAILEEHAFSVELAEREIPVAAPLLIDGRTLHQHEGMRFALFPRLSGRAPELSDPATLEWLGRFLGRIHAVGGLRRYCDRPALDIGSFGIEPRDWLLAHDFIPPDLLPAWRSTVDQALDGVHRAYERAGDVATLRLHGDCHMGNVLWQPGDGNRPEGGPQFVDFDDSRNGPAVQDLWMLLSGERSEMALQLGDILEGYEDFRDFDDRELYLVEALRTLRLLHYSAWLARRWDDPAFPAAFPWFNNQRYWQERILELREQIALMDEEPVWPE
ncbi:serine/threonine protein kinase [Azoarcus indigens]|uniref:Stress response kinase A n=1 Tax=Azoarcus indigens TaxID=29545 RepID=A0A4R6EEN6_9RHOO|nr:serine/threonine protein kinase [Azoarcus indigens]NMG65320.1 serine/threonine protein kinase [Azoarcus indigens]TDN56704.1 Ser/Thr protein kinase RdoA (MazF antagonist) [Azoarcus indigens]